MKSGLKLLPKARAASDARDVEELQLLRTAMDGASDPVYVVDAAALRFLYVNDAACRVLGTTREAHLAMPPWEPSGITRERLEETYRAVIARNGESVKAEVFGVNASRGHKGWFEVQRRALRFGERWLIVTNSREVSERKFAEEAALRHGRLYETLSATNEAIMRARSEEELYGLVCAAGVLAGSAAAAAVVVAEPGSDWLQFAAARGAIADSLRQKRISTDAASPYGQGLAGSAFRSGKPCVSNDFLKDGRTRAWHATLGAFGIKSAAGVPFTRNGATRGVLMLYADRKRAFDDEAVRLLERMAQNISFALENLERDGERQRAEARLNQSEARFRSLTELSSDWYWEQDAALRFTKFDGSGIAGERYQPARAVIGRLSWELPGIVVESANWAAHRARLERRDPFREFEYSYRDSKGNLHHLSVNGEPVYGADGGFLGYRGTSRDITTRKQAEERIQYLATHDALTGLPNRVIFSELLNHAIGAARRKACSLALLFVDLDRFKVINDTLGHQAGDGLLKDVAAQLKRCVRAADVVARLGGDEFVVLLEEGADANAAQAVARKLLEALARPIAVEGTDCRVTASIGIAMFPGDGQDEGALMKSADIAMYQAKDEGKNNFQFFSAANQSRSLGKMAMEGHLRGALERNELFLHYQPKKNLRTGAISGVEALLRWHNSVLGLVPPDEFIPLAEETGLILPIGRFVLREACERVAAWGRAGLPALRVAVNLSMRQLADPELPAQIAATLAQAGLPPGQLELEITESMVMSNPERMLALLTGIRDTGVQLSIDDFGTGYSSLGQLKRLPIDALKIDRSFIRDIPGDLEDEAIAETIIAMARKLGLTVIAEGVETQAQQDFLGLHDCDEMQGFHFARPLPHEEFEALLRQSAA
jgi:diguanylate cyclase (GGDEF)-like protein/PAS domain S-box-containing protein